MFNRKKSIEQKTRVQNRVLELSKFHKFLLLNLITGSGKTLASLKVAQKYNDKKWLILCKESNHAIEWQKELDKHKITIDYEIICYASLHKVKGNYNIICDEAHALTSKKRQLISKNINYDRILFLTATLPETKYNHLTILSKGNFKTLTLDLNTAIKLGILPIPEINIIYVKLTDNQLEKYKSIDRQVKLKASNYRDDKSKENYDSLMFISNKRKDIVANFKIQEVKKLINELNINKTRFICFCNSISQLDILRNDSNYYIHSKRDSQKQNESIIADFNTKKTNHLFTVKMLTESANLVDIEQGIVVQVDKGPLTTVQRYGRVLRANIPIITTYCVKDTMDEFYLENSLKAINKKYIKYHERTINHI